MKRLTVVFCCFVVFSTTQVEAQSAGSSEWQFQIAPLYLWAMDLDGTIGYASTSGGSSSKKRRNTALGATGGGLIARKPAEEGMLYTLNTGNAAIQVVTDQTEIHLDDCVVVEETSKGANIRRVSDDVCFPQNQEVVEALEAEFQEEAAECVAAKTELAAAKTDAEFDRAMTKVSILCND